MANYQKNLQEELTYLNQTVTYIKKEMETQAETLAERKQKLIASRRDMWENTAHSSRDFDKLTEMNQHLSEINRQTASYGSKLKYVEKYKRMIGTPYFGRIDFMENGYPSKEKIYIGIHSLIDSTTNEIYVYDWRAPISSLYYRNELGQASYYAPLGTLSGEVFLKRQYKIQDSKLKYFFDCSIRINDEILQDILSRNSSPNMRNIVETIQKEQDMIIRDLDNQLLIVQGVAGSGKTSIALHRIAFLLYEGLNSKISSNNVIIISPNDVFSNYISSVLPELGEENVAQSTFDHLVATASESKFKPETRAMQLESLIHSSPTKEGQVRMNSIAFKGSRTFVQILNRLLRYYAHRLIPIEDVYFNGRIIETRQQLKNRFLNNKTDIPMAKQLQRIENMILDQVHPLQKQRLARYEQIVANIDHHQLEIKSFSRLLAIKETKIFLQGLQKFTRVDYWQLYNQLFSQRGLFAIITKGLELPEDIDEIISYTKQNLNREQVNYEDCAPLFYLKLMINGHNSFSEIRQVVIDEAQDYYPMQFEVFKLLFNDARYTVLGDIHQTIEKDGEYDLYHQFTEILNKLKTSTIFLNKGYRSSYEINQFSQRVLGVRHDLVSFERHEKEPMLLHFNHHEQIDQAIINGLTALLEQGYESIGIISKTQHEAEIIYSRLKDTINVNLISPSAGKIQKGVSVVSTYMAKGLEFDVVLVYNASADYYSTELDRKLLYIACTRALHQLIIYYTGQKSPFIFTE